MEAPIITNLLTQDLLDSNDDVYSGESVWEECGTSTPISGEKFERLEENTAQQSLIKETLVSLQLFQELLECPISTSVTSTLVILLLLLSNNFW